MKFKDLELWAAFRVVGSTDAATKDEIRVKVSEDRFCRSKISTYTIGLDPEAEVEIVDLLLERVNWQRLKYGDLCRAGMHVFRILDFGKYQCLSGDGQLGTSTQVYYYDFESAKVLESELPYNELNQELLQTYSEMGRMASRNRDLVLRVIKKLMFRHNSVKARLESERKELIGHILDLYEELEGRDVLRRNAQDAREELKRERELREKRERQLRNLLKKQKRPRKMPKKPKKQPGRRKNIHLEDVGLSDYGLDFDENQLPFYVVWYHPEGSEVREHVEQYSAHRAVDRVRCRLDVDWCKAITHVAFLLQSQAGQPEGKSYIPLPATDHSVEGKLFVNVQ